MRLKPVLIASLVAVAAVVAPAASADALPLTTAATPGHGADLSWPQCGGAYPSDAAFGIVGVNTGLGNQTNPCLASELAWAEAIPRPAQPVALYVMSADPGQLGTWWPGSALTQRGTTVQIPASYGQCTPASSGSSVGQESAACAYVYGYGIAEQDATARGVSNPAAYRWWIDVETSNTWAPADSAGQLRNRADVEGMVAGLRAAGAAVGLYSTGFQWKQIMGSTPTTSPLAGLPSWIASTGGEGSAEAGCYSAPLTPGGSVALAQFQAAGADRDLICHRLTSTPTPTITGTTAVDQTLTAHAGSWRPAPVALHYQWNRNGKPIRGATRSTYRTVQSDGGHTITVTVTGSRSGWTTIGRTSSSHAIRVPVSKLAERHTLTTGATLLSPNGRYRLTQQSDGNLVLYKDTGKAIWSSHRFGKHYRTTMQADGNLVTYTASHHAVWSTRTYGKHAVSAVMQSDGNFVLYRSNGKAVWATHTRGR